MRSWRPIRCAGVFIRLGPDLRIRIGMVPARLPSEQEELLTVMVEAFRSVPRNERHSALIIDGFGGTVLVHNGLAAIGKESYRLYLGDAN